MQVGVLGPLEVRAEGGVVDVPGARLRGLLAALALRPGRVVSKTTLVDWIWGAQPPADAANALQRLASRLRKALPQGTVEGHADGYLLRVDPDRVDAVRFERLVAEARDDAADDAAPGRVERLREALALWRGAALQDVGVDSVAFDAAVTRLEGLRLTATEDRVDAEIALGRGAQLVTELSDLVAAHPLRERLVAALLRALVASGRDAEALLVYERTRELLAERLGVDPSPELSAVHVALLRGELAQEGDRSSNLRAELTNFVGKDVDVSAVRELIGGHRLTTLIGPGGAGKTRLAAETARTLLGGFPDGAWLVELAALGADGDVAPATLAALNLRDALLGDAADAEPTERVIAALRERTMLLILDNCEHVIESAAAFADRVLGECPRLRILATSREPLGITGEALWPVAPLGLPAEDADPDEITAAPAVQLLRDRAGAVRTDLADDAATLSTLARVCRALDGIPLAIELAAARLRTMSLEQLASRLDDRFRLLTGGSRTALPRHRTLRAVIDWSWELLSDAERVVLRRLSVFSGGASLDAAERVCAGDGVAPEEVLELLSALTEKSLVVAEGDTAPRYRLLGMIREYAARRLAETGEAQLTRRAHLAYVTDLAEAAEPHLRRAEQVEWLALLEAEHDNIAAAMRAAIAAGEAHEAMRLAAAVGWYWMLGGHRAEGVELTTAAAALSGEVPDDVRATAYAFAAYFVTAGQAGPQQAQHWISAAYELSRRVQRRHPALGFVAPLERMLREPTDFLSAFDPLLDDDDPWTRANARLTRGRMRILLGRDERDADADIEAALGEFRVIGERWGIAFALTAMAERLAMRGEFAGAAGHYEDAVAAVRDVGAIEDVVHIRAQQAQAHWLAGDERASAAALDEAQRWADRIVWPDALVELAVVKADLARWRGDRKRARQHVAEASTVLGGAGSEVEAYVGWATSDLLGYLAEDLDEARDHRRAALQAVAALGDGALLARVLVGVADLALRQSQLEQAARLLAASLAVRGLRDRSRPDAARIEEAVRRRLGDTRFAEATQQGEQEDWRELVAVTLAG